MKRSLQFPYRRPGRNIWDLRPQFAHGTRGHAVSSNSNNEMANQQRRKPVEQKEQQTSTCSTSSLSISCLSSTSLPLPPSPSEILLPVSCSRTHTQIPIDTSLLSSLATKSASTCTSTPPSSSSCCLILSIFNVMFPASPESTLTQLVQSSSRFIFGTLAVVSNSDVNN
jgi:hypothetical protein